MFGAAAWPARKVGSVAGWAAAGEVWLIPSLCGMMFCTLGPRVVVVWHGGSSRPWGWRRRALCFREKKGVEGCLAPPSPGWCGYVSVRVVMVRIAPCTWCLAGDAPSFWVYLWGVLLPLRLL